MIADVETIKAKCIVDDQDCWLWTLGTNGIGYGQIYISGTNNNSLGVHRVMYKLVKGNIPEGLILDHLCRNRLCCNPEHLEPVTNYENVVVRGEGLTAQKARQTHCKRGHALTGDNLYIIKGYGFRQCITCRVERDNARNELLKVKRNQLRQAAKERFK